MEAGPTVAQMIRTSPRGHVALFGSGTIGAGWAATYLAHHYQVRIVDPSNVAEDRTRAILDDVWPSVRQALPGAPLETPQALVSYVQAGAAVDGAAVVHESGPETVEGKREIYKIIEAEAQPDLVICSSSGGLMPTDLQHGMAHPGRFVVAHPFSPVYALPLVEVLGGERTSEFTVNWTLKHLATLGKKPIRLRREVPGYLTNRLTFALLREAVHCLAEGVTDAQSIEDAVVYGVTPRYVVGGPLTSLALAGGPDGMRGLVAAFSDAIETWWSDLGEPHLTEEVKTLLIDAADEIAAGRSLADLRAQRDAAAIALLRLNVDTQAGIDETEQP